MKYDLSQVVMMIQEIMEQLFEDQQLPENELKSLKDALEQIQNQPIGSDDLSWQKNTEDLLRDIIRLALSFFTKVAKEVFSNYPIKLAECLEQLEAITTEVKIQSDLDIELDTENLLNVIKKLQTFKNQIGFWQVEAELEDILIVDSAEEQGFYQNKIHEIKTEIVQIDTEIIRCEDDIRAKQQLAEHGNQQDHKNQQNYTDARQNWEFGGKPAILERRSNLQAKAKGYEKILEIPQEQNQLLAECKILKLDLKENIQPLQQKIIIIKQLIAFKLLFLLRNAIDDGLLLRINTAMEQKHTNEEILDLKTVNMVYFSKDYARELRCDLEIYKEKLQQAKELKQYVGTERVCDLTENLLDLRQQDELLHEDVQCVLIINSLVKTQTFFIKRFVVTYADRAQLPTPYFIQLADVEEVCASALMFGEGENIEDVYDLKIGANSTGIMSIGTYNIYTANNVDEIACLNLFLRTLQIAEQAYRLKYYTYNDLDLLLREKVEIKPKYFRFTPEQITEFNLITEQQHLDSPQNYIDRIKASLDFLRKLNQTEIVFSLERKYHYTIIPQHLLVNSPLFARIRLSMPNIFKHDYFKFGIDLASREFIFAELRNNSQEWLVLSEIVTPKNLLHEVDSFLQKLVLISCVKPQAFICDKFLFSMNAMGDFLHLTYSKLVDHGAQDLLISNAVDFIKDVLQKNAFSLALNDMTSIDRLGFNPIDKIMIAMHNALQEFLQQNAQKSLTDLVISSIGEEFFGIFLYKEILFKAKNNNKQYFILEDLLIHPYCQHLSATQLFIIIKVMIDIKVDPNWYLDHSSYHELSGEEFGQIALKIVKSYNFISKKTDPILSKLLSDERYLLVDGANLTKIIIAMVSRGLGSSSDLISHPNFINLPLDDFMQVMIVLADKSYDEENSVVLEKLLKDTRCLQIKGVKFCKLVIAMVNQGLDEKFYLNHPSFATLSVEDFTLVVMAVLKKDQKPAVSRYALAIPLHLQVHNSQFAKNNLLFTLLADQRYRQIQGAELAKIIVLMINRGLESALYCNQGYYNKLSGGDFVQVVRAMIGNGIIDYLKHPAFAQLNGQELGYVIAALGGQAQHVERENALSVINACITHSAYQYISYEAFVDLLKCNYKYRRFCEAKSLKLQAKNINFLKLYGEDLKIFILTVIENRDHDPELENLYLKHLNYLTIDKKDFVDIIFTMAKHGIKHYADHPAYRTLEGDDLTKVVIFFIEQEVDYVNHPNFEKLASAQISIIVEHFLTRFEHIIASNIQKQARDRDMAELDLIYQMDTFNDCNYDYQLGCPCLYMRKSQILVFAEQLFFLLDKANFSQEKLEDIYLKLAQSLLLVCSPYADSLPELQGQLCNIIRQANEQKDTRNLVEIITAQADTELFISMLQGLYHHDDGEDNITPKSALIVCLNCSKYKSLMGMDLLRAITYIYKIDNSITFDHPNIKTITQQNLMDLLESISLDQSLIRLPSTKKKLLDLQGKIALAPEEFLPECIKFFANILVINTQDALREKVLFGHRLLDNEYEVDEIPLVPFNEQMRELVIEQEEPVVVPEQQILLNLLGAKPENPEDEPQSTETQSEHFSLD